jgi:hypothetical protein
MYEKGNLPRLLGCLVPLAGGLLIATCAFRNFFDASSNQSASECETMMVDRIMSKVAELPDDTILRSKSVIVEHELRGNREQTEPLAMYLRARGKGVRVDTLEVGTNLVIQDQVQSFRKLAAPRLKALCDFAAANHLKYDSWWLSGDRYSDYVSQ